MSRQIERLLVRASGPSRINVEEFTNSANHSGHAAGTGFSASDQLVIFPREAHALMEALQIFLGNTNG